MHLFTVLYRSGFIKSTADRLTAFETGQVVNNAYDMMDMLADKRTSVRLFHHTEQDTGRMRALVPGKLSPLPVLFSCTRFSSQKRG